MHGLMYPCHYVSMFVRVYMWYDFWKWADWMKTEFTTHHCIHLSCIFNKYNAFIFIHMIEWMKAEFYHALLHVQRTCVDKLTKEREEEVRAHTQHWWNFSKVTFLFNLLYKFPLALTFQNFCQHWIWGRGRHGAPPLPSTNNCPQITRDVGGVERSRGVGRSRREVGCCCNDDEAGDFCAEARTKTRQDSFLFVTRITKDKKKRPYVLLPFAAGGHLFSCGVQVYRVCLCTDKMYIRGGEKPQQS